MKPAASLFCGFLLTLAYLPAFAEPQALIAVDPNNFAPGQNISRATFGANLRALLFVPNPQIPDVFMPQYSPVYSQSVTPDCVALDTLPCSPIGSSLLGYSPVSTPSSSPINWGEANLAPPCLFFNECTLANVGSLTITPALTMNLDAPTNFVSALIPWREDGGFLVAFAFNSAGVPVASCYDFPGTSSPGCAASIFFTGNNPQEIWVQYEMSDPNSDISFVIIGGAGTLRPIAQIQFNSPVSLQLDGLIKKVAVVAPREGLAIALLIARVYYAVHDFRATCAILTGVDHDVKAQRGRRINTLSASQLLATTGAIETALSCQ
jgi:hypothetical protein